MVGTYFFVFLSLCALSASVNICNTYSESPLYPICFGQGQCVNNSATDFQPQCICDARYDGERCEYVRKDKTVAFMLSFFFGCLGADRFYLGYTSIAVGKLLVCTFGGLLIGSLLIIPCALFEGTKGEKVAGGFCMSLVLVASLIWWMVEWIFILQNKTNDNNGHSLVPWS